MSGYACFQGDTWGYDRGGIWVSNGCAARFQLGPNEPEARSLDLESSGVVKRQRGVVLPLTTAPSPDDLPLQVPTPARAPTQIVVCESKQYARTFCAAEVSSHVELRKKLSSAACRFNKTWGYDFEAVWVSEGCRAEFAVY
ncbi:MAG TPA: hypothetical protein DCL54_01310 [Alphaproteobacteria bacterium]|nr:hypothetical protein [Alphaproteobacteria bacterium]HAJ45204.1 hypothetical protein [Alphaproteobacteria bacterium]